MEHDTEYQKANQKIKELQQYYERLSELPKAQSEAHKDIETHFEMCFKALEARKTYLLRQVDLAFEQQMKVHNEEREKVKKALDGYTKLINSSSDLYNMNPELSKNVWKTIYTYDNSQKKPSITCVIDLPVTLINFIENHGGVIQSQQSAGEGDSSQQIFNAGAISTLAGSYKGMQDGIGTYVQMSYPVGIILNPSDDHLYFCDYRNGAFRQASKKGEVVSFAKVAKPWSIAWFQKETCFFVTSQDHTISKVSVTGKEVTLVAGTAGLSGNKDGAKASARFCHPRGITIDPQTGNIYVCDQGNHLIRKITPQGDVSTLAGTCGSSGHADGLGSSVKFNYPLGIAFFEKQQCLVICDHSNNKLRRVNLDGEVSTLCVINTPISFAVINNTSFLVSSASFNIFKVTHQNLQKESVRVEEFAGAGQCGYPRESKIGNVYGMAFDSSTSTCYFTDCDANSIRKLELLRRMRVLF